MTNIVAFRFDTPDGAGEMLELIQQLAVGQSIGVEDAAVVTWLPGERKPRTRHVAELSGVCALGGGFWGLLFGQVFFVPSLGMAVAAAMGALAGKLSTYGIDRRFVQGVSEKVIEGTSALFLMTSRAVVDRVAETASRNGWAFEIISANMTPEQAQALRQDFGAVATEQRTIAGRPEESH